MIEKKDSARKAFYIIERTPPFMIYNHTLTGTFLSRPNRFIAHVLISDEKNGVSKEVVCHVKNTGRCHELLIPGVTVLLEFHPNAASSGRKTEYSLIGVYKVRDSGPLLINMDSQAPNKAAWEWLVSMEEGPFLPLHGEENGAGFLTKRLEHIKREVTYKNSRFDLAFDYSFTNEKTGERLVRPSFMEVKGVTLEENGRAMFPDAPTLRGVKHLLELAEAAKSGYEAYVLFVIQMKEMASFSPNNKTHPQFGDALKTAMAKGVHILAYDCGVTKCSMVLENPIAVSLP